MEIRKYKVLNGVFQGESVPKIEPAPQTRCLTYRAKEYAYYMEIQKKWYEKPVSILLWDKVQNDLGYDTPKHYIEHGYIDGKPCMLILNDIDTEKLYAEYHLIIGDIFTLVEEKYILSHFNTKRVETMIDKHIVLECNYPLDCLEIVQINANLVNNLFEGYCDALTENGIGKIFWKIGIKMKP